MKSSISASISSSRMALAAWSTSNHHGPLEVGDRAGYRVYEAATVSARRFMGGGLVVPKSYAWYPGEADRRSRKRPTSAARFIQQQRRVMSSRPEDSQLRAL